VEAVFEIKGLNKKFGGLQALRDFDLKVYEGDLIGIIGPNGAGKTTLFNLITGFLRPNSGEVWFKNMNITHLKPFQIVNLGISRTFQLVELFKEMTVLENLLIPCFCRRSKERRPKGKRPWVVAVEVLEEIGLGDKCSEFIKNLTYGELRLLDIARAIATEPDIILLDEPFSGLDPRDAALLSNVISRMHRKGQTTIMIEHRLTDLLKLVERVVAIVFGKKIAEGIPEEIIRDKTVVKAYLGEREE